LSITIIDPVIHITGNAGVEEAEILLVALQRNPTHSVDLSQTAHLHSAVVQLLLALRPGVSGTPEQPFLIAHVMPLLDQSSERE
jgi:hypothetical protein